MDRSSDCVKLDPIAFGIVAKRLDFDPIGPVVVTKNVAVEPHALSHARFELVPSSDYTIPSLR